MERTANDMIRAYTVRMHEDGEHIIITAPKKLSQRQKDDLDWIKAHKVEIVRELKTKAEIRARRGAKVMELREGVAAIENARREMAEWHYHFNKSFEGDCGGMNVGAMPDPNEEKELCKKYPVAAAYLKAHSWLVSSNIVKSIIGKDAENRILDGEDAQKAIEDMEAQWKEYCDAHAFD